MASVKREKYAKEDIRLAKIAKAMEHPARIAILRQIASMNTCCFNDISKELPVADSTVSQHLTELKSAGLIRGNYKPPKIIYSIGFEEWKRAKKLLKEFMKIQIVKSINDL